VARGFQPLAFLPCFDYFRVIIHSYESMVAGFFLLLSHTITVPAFQEIPGAIGFLVHSL
jgi:hypothetical protein